MNEQKGKFIVFEGIDGSGKSTQTKLLKQELENRGLQTVKVDFPQYGEPSAYFVEQYLNGQYGSLDEVGPYRASLFYALDRYQASFKIKNLLEQGTMVIADRYTGSNIGHQGGKIKNKEKWKKYVDWLFQLEYKLLQIPKPDINIILKTNTQFSQKLSFKIIDKEKQKRRTALLGEKKWDIHEENKNHLDNALQSFLTAAQEYPEDFAVVDCIENGQLLGPEVIHQKVLAIVKKIINY